MAQKDMTDLDKLLKQASTIPKREEMVPVVCKSLSDEDFMSKNDVLVGIHNDAIKSPLYSSIFRATFTRTLFFLFFNHLTRQLQDCQFFVRFSSKMFKNFADEINAEFEKLKKKQTKSLSLREVEERIEKLFPMDRLDLATIRAMVKLQEANLKDLSPICLLIKSIQKAVGKRPEVFLPYSKTNPKEKNVPVTIRLFEDRNQQYVLEQEMNEVLEIGETFGDDDILFTRSLDFLKKYQPGALDTVQLVRTNVPKKDFIVARSGEKWKLAVDVLSDFLDDAFNNFQLLRKIDADSWSRVEEFFRFAQVYFMADMTDPYFLRKVYVERFQQKVAAFYASFGEKTRAPISGSGELTVEELRNKLNQRKIDQVFPKVLLWAGVAYRMVANKKNKKTLKMADADEAIDECVRIGLFRNIEKLSEFIHRQHACDQLIPSHCEFCIRSSSSSSSQAPKPAKAAKKVHNESKWKHVKASKIRIHEQKNDNIDRHLILDEAGGVIRYNDNLLNRDSAEKKFVVEKVFLLDKEDILFLQAPIKYDEQLFPLLKSLRDFETNAKGYQKNIYLRSFMSNAANFSDRETDVRVFAEETLEVISLLLKRQKTFRREHIDKLEQYHNKWTVKDGDYAINLQELKDVLEDFDVDKNAITIFPDNFDVISALVAARNLDETTFLAYGPNLDPAIAAAECQFHIFEKIICAVDWTSDVCKQHSNCLAGLRKVTMNALKEFAGAKKNHYFSVDKQNYLLTECARHCSFMHPDSPTTPIPGFSDSSDSITMWEFVKTCAKFGITAWRMPGGFSQKQLEESVMENGKAKVLLMKGWIEVFFGNDEPELKKSLLDSLRLRVPIAQWEQGQDFEDMMIWMVENNYEKYRLFGATHVMGLRGKRESAEIIRAVLKPGSESKKVEKNKKTKTEKAEPSVVEKKQKKEKNATEKVNNLLTLQILKKPETVEKTSGSSSKNQTNLELENGRLTAKLEVEKKRIAELERVLEAEKKNSSKMEESLRESFRSMRKKDLEEILKLKQELNEAKGGVKRTPSDSEKELAREKEKNELLEGEVRRLQDIVRQGVDSEADTVEMKRLRAQVEDLTLKANIREATCSTLMGIIGQQLQENEGSSSVVGNYSITTQKKSKK